MSEADLEIPRGTRETKFVLGARAAPRVLGRLKARCHVDPSWPVGVVSSIYYDTPDWLHLREKLNGSRSKSKVRLRWYASAKTGEPIGTGILELKAKGGALRSKLRVDTGIPAAEIARQKLSGAAMRRVLGVLRDEGHPASGALLPAFEIRYLRYRFVDPLTESRLSLDTQIRVSRTNPARVPPGRPFVLRQSVLEVKGHLDDLPASLEELRALGCRKEAFSKYSMCEHFIRYAHQEAGGGVG